MSEYQYLLDETTLVIGKLHIIRSRVARGEGDQLQHIKRALELTKDLAAYTHTQCHGEDESIDMHRLFSIDADVNKLVMGEAAQLKGNHDLMNRACMAILDRMIETAGLIANMSASCGGKV